MGSLNKVILIGNLGKDPEIRTTPGGAKVANFSIATTERYTDKQGQKVDKTEWHNIVMWRGLADVAERWLKKGAMVCIEGKLETRSWEKTPGDKRYSTDINASNMQMLGSKGEEPYVPTRASGLENTQQLPPTPDEAAMPWDDSNF